MFTWMLMIACIVAWGLAVFLMKIAGDKLGAYTSAVSLILGANYRRLIVPLIVFVLLTLYCRPYLGMHYPLDVLVGALAGVLAGILVLWLSGRGRRKPPDPIS